MGTENARQPTEPQAGDLRMPAEWEPHEATWLAWPHNGGDWPGKLSAVQWAYVEIIRKLTRDERVRLLTPSDASQPRIRARLRRAGVDSERVELMTCPTNRSWTRDTGPVFVRHATSRNGVAIVDFHFNAWARYATWRLDRRIPALAARRLDVPLLEARHGKRDFVLEGGAIETNGCGTLLATEECLLSQRRQVRNPGFSPREVAEALERWLGATKVQWLGRGIEGDDTHGHVDDFCRFVDRRTIVLARERNRSDPNYAALEENAERLQDLVLEDGTRPRVISLPMPAPLRFGRWRLPASYANFYIANARVLVPTFNDPQDRAALGILADLFPDREVVGIHAVDLVLGLGSVHCLTQQEPAVKPGTR